jgi:hypothetical protein
MHVHLADRDWDASRQAEPPRPFGAQFSRRGIRIMGPSIEPVAQIRERGIESAEEGLVG